MSLVGLIYFSSLAGLAALAGPITAIVALGLQATADRRMERREGRLARYLRKWLLRWRYRRVRTIEKPVEVFVDREVEKIVEIPRDVIREVEKRVEVPREVITKEIVYIPLLTDDPDLVRKPDARRLTSRFGRFGSSHTCGGTKLNVRHDTRLLEAAIRVILDRAQIPAQQARRAAELASQRAGAIR